MDYYDLKRLALIKAVEAELKGMVAENEYCKYNIESFSGFVSVCPCTNVQIIVES